MGVITKFKAKIHIVADFEDLSRQSLEQFVTDAKKAIKSRNFFYVAISGGSTPRRFFELLGEEPRSLTLPWEKIHLFWVDERYVPPDSQSSNYKMAAESFLEKVGIPDENIHRIPTEYGDSNAACHEYENTIREVFGLHESQIPQFDLILLGMGRDGHTGSLFPNTYASLDTQDLVCVVYVLDEKLNRITMTQPVLCAARHIVVQISGREKADIVKKVFSSEPDEVQYPIHILWPVLDRVTWLIDKEAAGGL